MGSRRRVAILAATAAAVFGIPLAVDAGANHSQTDLLSIGPNGGNGTPLAQYGGISTDGSRVFFTTAESLVSTDTDSSDDVYERAGGTTTLISTGPINGNSAHQARYAGVSADGTRVFFDTSEQLTTTDTDSGRDVYERFAGTTTHVSIGPNGGNSGIDSFYAGNSTDGTRVSIMSYDPLTSNDTDTGRKDVYQRSGGTITLMSTGGNGPYGADYDGATPDGTRVFFHTDESLAGTDSDGIRDVYEHSGGTTVQVSTGPINGNGAFAALYKGVSQDGSLVFFASNEQLTTSDTDSRGDVFQRSGGTTTKLSLGPNGGNGAFDTNLVGASADGSKVWLETREALVSGDTDGSCENDVGQFILPCLDVYERTGGTTTLISTGGNGSYEASMGTATPDGTHVFFHTTESLDPADTVANTFDVYDRSGGTTTLITPGGNGASFISGISKDGARVFFSTYESLVGADTDNWNDVYERYGGATTLISTGPTSSSTTSIVFFYSASEDGTKVFFDTDEKLTAADTDASFDIYSASQVVAGFRRPKSANRSSVTLVPAFAPCASPNRNHGPPLAHPSCNPPVQQSSVLTVGSPDVNGFAANSEARFRLTAIVGAPGPPDDSNIEVLVKVSDVRCRVTNAACPGGSGSDFTGNLLLTTSIRLTDKLNGSPAVESATMQNFPLEVPVACAATTATTTGGNCTLTTMINALIPGAVKDGKRAIWAQEAVEAHDPGPNGTGYGAGCPGTCGDGDESVYMRQGVFIP